MQASFIQQLILKTNAAEVCREDIWNAVFAENRVDLLVWWTHRQDFNSQTLPPNVLGFVGVAQDNLEWVQKACHHGLDINSRHVMPDIEWSPSLAMLAVEHGRSLEFIQNLFRLGATNDIESYSDTVMRFAAKYGRVDIMEWLVEELYATVDDVPTRSVVQGHEVVHEVQGDPGLGDMGALAGDEKSRFQGDDGSPLMCAIKADQMRAALWLINQGADLMICDNTWSRGPLDYAALSWKYAKRDRKADAADQKEFALALIQAVEKESVPQSPREIIVRFDIEGLKLDFLETTAWAELESDLERKLVLIAELSDQRKGLGAGFTQVQLDLTNLCINLAEANLDWHSLERAV